MSNHRQGRAQCSVPEELAYNEDTLKRHVLVSLAIELFDTMIPENWELELLKGSCAGIRRRLEPGAGQKESVSQEKTTQRSEDLQT